MKRELYISGLSKLGGYLNEFLSKNQQEFNEKDNLLLEKIKKSEYKNSWFSELNQRYALNNWANLLNEENLSRWLKNYSWVENPKKVGLILAGNISLVGFHDVLSVILSGHFPVIKLSSKDDVLIPFLLELWNEFSSNEINYEIKEKLVDYQAVIATGSNNTARYLEYYFREVPCLIRKNRTSVAVLSGRESMQDLELLARDIFLYYGLGCRNVTKVFLPQGFELSTLFEAFMGYKEVILHHKYANNYEYNRAIYLLNQDEFWDNNFVLLKKDEGFFSPIGVLYFDFYSDLDSVREVLSQNTENIQCIVGKDIDIQGIVSFGESQMPDLDTYADGVDTMAFLSGL